MMNEKKEHAASVNGKTPMELAASIRQYLAREKWAIVTLNTRKEMDMVVEHLTSDELKRTRFQFHS